MKNGIVTMHVEVKVDLSYLDSLTPDEVAGVTAVYAEAVKRIRDAAGLLEDEITQKVTT